MKPTSFHANYFNPNYGPPAAAPLPASASHLPPPSSRHSLPYNGLYAPPASAMPAHSSRANPVHAQPPLVIAQPRPIVPSAPFQPTRTAIKKAIPRIPYQIYAPALPPAPAASAQAHPGIPYPAYGAPLSSATQPYSNTVELPPRGLPQQRQRAMSGATMRHNLMAQHRDAEEIIPFIPPSPSPDLPEKKELGKSVYHESRFYQERAMSGSAMHHQPMAQHRDAEEITPFIPPSPSELDLAEKKKLAKSVYDEGKFYQGTTDIHAADRRANGMDPNHKVGSSVDNGLALGVARVHPSQVAKFRNDALTHFYFTKLRAGSRAGIGTATDYARLASAKGGRPKVIRAFLTEESSVSLQPDPDSPAASLAFRTRDKVEAGSVLQSKKAPLAVTKASEDFKSRFNKHPSRSRSGIGRIGSREAARRLQEAQSDSEDDFDDRPSARLR